MSTFTYVLTVTAADSTSATFTPAQAKFAAPVAPGTVIGTVSVEPSDWNGLVVVGAPFAMSGMNVVVGAAPLAAGVYSISGNSVP